VHAQQQRPDPVVERIILPVTPVDHCSGAMNEQPS
jgi:hypothetical protein